MVEVHCGQAAISGRPLMLHGWAPSVGHFLTGAVLAILCLAAAHDVLARTVPNWMPMTLAALGIIQSAIDERLIVSLLVGAMVFILTGLCWKRGWLGGGDVKLLGAAAIAVPPLAVPPVGVRGRARRRRARPGLSRVRSTHSGLGAAAPSWSPAT